jgi:NAD+ synthase (glutamine-hydrolysing)
MSAAPQSIFGPAYNAVQTSLEAQTAPLAGTRQLTDEEAKKLQFVEQPIVNLATCNLNQMALDFTGNQRRIIESIILAKAAGCTYRLGPELEITGYSCEDHFYELDTISFAWMSLRDIILTQHEGKDLMSNILCDFGMPILHNGVRYNCRVFVLGRKILLIRPKMWMADDGNYREDRHFTPWDKDKIETMEDYQLPEAIHDALEPLADGKPQTTAPFGVAILQCKDATIGAEICEELFTAESTNILLGFEGCDIMSNGSASHFEVGKRLRRHDLIKEATKKNGGIYMYSNMIGCDGNRLVFDGNGMIYMNGNLKAVGEHLIFHEVEVVTAKLNLNEVRTYRAKSVSHQMQSDQRSVKMHRINVDFNLTINKNTAAGEFIVSDTIPIPEMPMEEEMGKAVSRWLFDYLTRSGSGSFLLPLSGGVDSSSTAMFVYFMCSIIVELFKQTKYVDGESPAIARHRDFLYKRLDPHVFRHCKGINGTPKFCRQNHAWIGGEVKTAGTPTPDNALTPPTDPRQLMNVILYTVNMPTKNNTAKIMRYALNLADALGSYHITANINDAFVGIKDIVSNLTFGTKFSKDTTVNPAEFTTAEEQRNLDRFTQEARETIPANEIIQIPRYKNRDGIGGETLAIQNIQARVRMLTAFYLSQILPLHRSAVDTMGVAELDQYQTAKSQAIGKAKVDPANTGKRDEDIAFTQELDAAGKELHTKYSGALGLAQMCLVLASSNSDEALRGFYTKYDAASADVNPIGSFSKHDLRKFLFYCMATKFRAQNQEIYPEKFNEETIDGLVVPPEYPFKILHSILTVVASPELEPVSEDGTIQDDELAIQLTYPDLYDFGIMRKNKLGPIGMFNKMCKDRLGKVQTDIIPGVSKTRAAATPITIFNKIKTFFKQYGMNRHKMTILTPALHATDYSPDDNRFDQRPFLYPNDLSKSIEYQLNIVETLAKNMMGRADVNQLVNQVDLTKDRQYTEQATRADKFKSEAGQREEAKKAVAAAKTASLARAEETARFLRENEGARGGRRRVTRDKKRDAKKRKTRKN